MMSAIGPKRIFLVALHMFAFGGEADIGYGNVSWRKKGGKPGFDSVFHPW